MDEITIGSNYDGPTLECSRCKAPEGWKLTIDLPRNCSPQRAVEIAEEHRATHER